jgi:hypothetical protein
MMSSMEMLPLCLMFFSCTDVHTGRKDVRGTVRQGGKASEDGEQGNNKKAGRKVGKAA